jgi:hypothetical protein
MTLRKKWLYLSFMSSYPKSAGDAMRAILKKRELLKGLPISSKATMGNNIHPIERVMIRTPYSNTMEISQNRSQPLAFLT